MSRKLQVKKALEFDSPDYLPLVYFNGNRNLSDIIMIDVVEHYGGLDSDTSEWGFRWERMDDTMGQPTAPVIRELSEISTIRVPDPHRPDRFRSVTPTMREFGPDRYYIASLQLSGFTVMSALRGFADTLIELHSEPRGISELADIVFGFENEVITRLADRGFDAVAFFDDWGMQDGMIVSPELWRHHFYERYQKQFRLVHDSGMQVYFHCCGYFYDIIADLIEAGVDILNISQPNLYDLRRLTSDFQGKLSFAFPVSYQTTSITGTRQEIFEYVENLLAVFKAREGGVIGYLEEYESIGMSRSNYLACEEAFRTCGDFRVPD